MKQQTWEEEIDKWVEEQQPTQHVEGAAIITVVCQTPQFLKSFVQSELQRQRESIVEEIKGMRVKSFGRDSQFKCLSANAIYNQALDDIIKKVGGE